MKATASSERTAYRTAHDSSPKEWFRRSEFLGLAVPFFIACFPLLWALPLQRQFYADWYNNLWIIAYTGEYFRRNLQFPLTLNTVQAIGVPFPIFYGTLLYPIAGIVSSVVGAAISLRILLLAVSWVQAGVVVKLVQAIYPDRKAAWAIAAVVSFATYPLTNVYNRSAIAEFVAASLLVSACCLWFRAVYCERETNRIACSAAWFLLALSAGSHPITAVLGLSCFAVLVLVAIMGSAERRTVLGVTLWNAALLFASISPWLYVTLTFHKQLLVMTVFPSVQVFSDSIGLGWVRFFPVPFDIRTLKPVLVRSILTPCLDAQINFGLLLVAVLLWYEAFRQIRQRQLTMKNYVVAAGCCSVVFVLTVYASLSTWAWAHGLGILGFIQFSYRLITYCDLALLLTVITLLKGLSAVRSDIRNRLGMYLAIAVALSIAGVLIKFEHAAAIEVTGVVPGTERTGNRAVLTELPQWFYGLDGYVAREGFKKAVGQGRLIRLSPDVDTHFGAVSPTLLNGSGLFETNVQAFPWNRLVLDGKPLLPSDTYVTEYHRLAAYSARKQTSVSYSFIPDRTYVCLRWLSGIVVCAWACWLISAGFWKQAVRSRDGWSTRLKRTSITSIRWTGYYAIMAGVLAAGYSVVQLTPVPGSAAEQPTPGIPGGRTTLIAAMRVKFPNEPSVVNRRDPLVVAGVTGAADITSVSYVGSSQLRFRIDHWGFAPVESEIIEINPDDTYLVEVLVGEYGVAIRMNGIVVLRFKGKPYPTQGQVEFGENGIGGGVTGARFSGQILSTAIKRPVPPPILLASMRVQFPKRRQLSSLGEPLLVTGVTGAGELVSVRYEPENRVQFQIDHWGVAPVRSAPMEIQPGKTYVLEVGAGPGGVSLCVDSVEVVRSEVAAYPTTRDQVTFGENRIGGGTTVANFSGNVLVSKLELRQ